MIDKEAMIRSILTVVHPDMRDAVEYDIRTLLGETAMAKAECAGPSVDARDCPVHAKDVKKWTP